MNLNAQLFISKNNDIVFSFDQRLPVILSAIKLNENTHLLDLCFYADEKTDLEAHLQLNCPIDKDALEIMLKKSHCVVGFFNGNTLVETAYLPLLHKNSDFGSKNGVR